MHRPGDSVRKPCLSVSAALFIAALSLACGGGDSSGPPGPAADLAGTWTWFEQIADVAQGYACTDQGLLELTQTQNEIGGTAHQDGQCTVPGDSAVGNSGSASIHQGSATLESVEFSFADCHYRGQLHHDPVDSMAGGVSCAARVTGRQVVLEGSWFAVRGVDVAPPTVSGHFSAPAGDTLLVPNDALSITVEATDDRKVQWVGFRLGAPISRQDSARVDAAAGSRTFEVPVSAGDVGLQRLSFFARDGLGRLTADTESVRVIDAVRRPLHTVPLGAIATDMAFDGRRNYLYLLVPERAEVDVLDLATFALRAPIALPFAPIGDRAMQLDILPGGDSLVVAPTGPGVVFVDLLTGASSTRAISGPDFLINRVRTVASNKVFVLGSVSSAGYIYYGLWEYDVSSGTSRRHTEVGQAGNLAGWTTELARSSDHSRLLLLDVNTGCAAVYTSATDQFTPCATLGFTSPSTPTASTTGDRWLLRHLLADATPSVLATVRPLDPGAGTISPGATLAYYPDQYGVEAVRLPDGVSLGRIRLQVHATRLTMLPDGKRLIVWTDPGSTSEMLNTDRVTIVDVE